MVQREYQTGLAPARQLGKFAEFPQQALFLLQKKADLRASRHPMDARKQL